MAISIETTQNVTIDYEIASIGDRVLALIVDGFVVLAYFLLIALFGQVTGFDPGTAGSVIIYLPTFIYHPLCETFLEGQTFGKKAMRTKVVKLDGTEPGIGGYLLRWLLLPIDSAFALGLLVMAIGGKGQRLGDLAAGTTVIKLKPRMALSETLMPELEEEYTPTYPGVMKLTDRDIAIIRDVWSAGRKQDTRATINALVTRVASVIGAERPTDPDRFLETVVRDYTWYTQQ